MATKLWWLIVVALALVACTQPQPTLPAPGGSAVETPKFGGVLNTWGEDFTDFDMGGPQGRSGPNVDKHSLVYDGLVGFKKGPEAEYVSQILQPELAERWDVSPDAQTYTYYLRKGVKFADIPPVNGRELTTADVKWSLEYYSRTGEFQDKKLPPSQTRELYLGLENIEIPDRYTVRIRFKEPFAPFLNYSASQWMPIAAPETYKADENPPGIKTLVGTGPYIYDLKNSQKDTRFVFSKNPSYWDAPKPYLDSLRRLIIPDVSTRLAAFQAKQIDILAASDFATAQQIKQANPQAIYFESLSHGHRVLMPSQRPGRHPALADIRVRRALSLAVDRDEMNKVLEGGTSAWALAGSWPGLFTDAEAHALLRHDPAEAKRLLAEAGYASGLTLELLPVGAPGIPDELVQAQLKRVGVDVTLTILPREQNRAKLFFGDFDLFFDGSTTLGDGDFDGFLFSYHSSSGQNWAVLKDPELDTLVLAQRRERDPQKRREAQRAEVRHINANVWNIALNYYVVRQFWQPHVKNYRPHWTTGEKDAFVWLDK